VVKCGAELVIKKVWFDFFVGFEKTVRYANQSFKILQLQKA